MARPVRNRPRPVSRAVFMSASCRWVSLFSVRRLRMCWLSLVSHSGCPMRANRLSSRVSSWVSLLVSCTRRYSENDCSARMSLTYFALSPSNWCDTHRGQRVEQVVTKLKTLSMTDIRTDSVRQVGRRDRNDKSGDISQPCGVCTRGKIVIASNGEVWSCLFAR